MKLYQNYIFDLYGTLVDIRTDEKQQMLWHKMSLFYGYYGAVYSADELQALYNKLVSYGFECVKPEGAFYLWVKALEDDDISFVNKAKEFNLLLVPGSSFMCPGYVRIAYCVDTDMIKRSFVQFEKLARCYN